MVLPHHMPSGEQQRGGSGTPENNDWSASMKKITVEAKSKQNGMTVSEMRDAIQGLPGNAHISAMVTISKSRIKSITVETAS
jgi:hypothetical protein